MENAKNINNVYGKTVEDLNRLSYKRLMWAMYIETIEPGTEVSVDTFEDLADLGLLTVVEIVGADSIKIKGGYYKYTNGNTTVLGIPKYWNDEEE